MLEGITIRNYQPGDSPSLVALVNESDAIDGLERATTLEEMEHDMSWPNYDAARDCFLAWAGDNLVGYADLYLRRASSGEEHKFFTWGLVHPAWRRQGLGRRLLELLYHRASDRLGELSGGPVHFRGQAREVEAGRIALMQGFGMEPVRYSINMARPLDGDLPRVVMPSGYTLRTFEPVHDVETVWEVQNLAFRDHWGYSEFPLVEFAYSLERPNFRPELWTLALEESSGQVVGLGLDWIDPEWIKATGRQEGTVQVLAVLREHRQQGLGSALLTQCLHALRAGGMEWAQLGADANNLTGAVRLYQRAGFAIRKTYTTFSKVMREV